MDRIRYAVLILLALSPASLSAAGREFGLRAHDLNIAVDTRWAGNMQGGYYPIRIRVVNTGPSCRLTFRFVPDDEGLPAVRRTDVVADQNATLQLSLPVPMVGRGTSGRLEIEKDGELLRDFAQRLALADSFGNSPPRPSLLIIAAEGVQAGHFEAAVNMLHGGNGYGVAVYEDHEQIPPAMLPQSWLEYSGLDLVAIPLTTLAGIGSEPRSALLNWVRCGGTLLVYDVGGPVEDSAELGRLLDLARGAAVSPQWRPADPAQAGGGAGGGVGGGALQLLQDRFMRMNPRELLEMAQDPQRLEQRMAEEMQRLGVPGSPAAFSRWDRSKSAFMHRNIMLGRVYAFAENPFPGSPADWQWLLQSIGQERYQWMTRHGASTRAESHEFLHFTIPGLQSIPIYAFLILISLFTLVIGPVNYIWLWKRRQTWLLVLTIPVLAFATSLTLFAYSTLSHGFSVKSRVRSLTVLDQKNNTAVATSRIALFAGMAPSGGLTFSPETAVYPVWPVNQGFGAGVVDWSQTQALESGWLHSRTRTQFLTVSNREERGRIEIGRPNAGALEVSNGLEWDIESLVVAGPDGTLYAGTNVPAGGSTRLARATSESLRALAEQLRRDPLEPPPELADPRRVGRQRMWLQGPETYSAHLHESWMEQQIQRLQQIATQDVLPPGSYLAILAESPDIELGVPSTDRRGEFHLLLGYF